MRRRAVEVLAAILLAATSGRAVAQEGPGSGDAMAPDAGTADVSPGQPAEAVAAPVESQGGAGLFEGSSGAAAALAGAGVSAPDGLKLSGYVRGDVYVGKIPGVNQADMKAGYGEAGLIVRTKKEAFGDGFADLRLRYGMQGEKQQQATVDVREAYVNAYLGPVDIRLGKQIIVWGRADMLNPTNNITPTDLRVRSPIEDDRRLGNVGARMFLRFAPVRLEGVWMPTYVPSELPPVGLPEFVGFGTPVFPEPKIKNGAEGGRLHLELASVEMSASYLYGYAPLPGLTLTNVTFDPATPSVLVSRTAYKQQVVGFDFSTALGDILAIRGEVAYRRPVDYKTHPNAPRPDLQYVLGGDHQFGSVSVIAQYLGRYAFDWTRESGNLTPLDPDSLKMTPANGQSYLKGVTETINNELARINQMLFSQTARVQHLGTVRVEWLLAHDTLSLSALGMVNFTTKEWLAAPKVGYRLSDTMTAYVGAEVLTGPSGTLFGLVDQTLSAGYAELRSTF